MTQNSDKLALPYAEIPSQSAVYSTENVVARMIDGLGYRYYWATDSLRASDLSFKPSDDARSMEETIDHLFALSQTILNAIGNKVNVRPVEEQAQSFDIKRSKTLNNLKVASDLLKSGSKAAESNILFQRGDVTSSFPFWNLLNGPLADAISHVGQVVSFRRSSGNPINPKVNVFMGKNRE